MTHLAMTATALGVSTEAQDKLNDFISLFMKWNRSINLSGARTEDQIEVHIVDCLHAIPHLRALDAAHDPSQAAASSSVLDVGAGGGMPSVVVAICLPNLQ